MARPALKATRDIISNYIDRYWRYAPSPLSVKQLMDYGETATIRDSYGFLRCELPIRLAHIMKEVRHLPYALMEMPSIKRLDNWYSQSLIELVDFRERNSDESSESKADDFTLLIEKIKNRHDPVVETMAKGIMELKECINGDCLDRSSLQYFLDRFYINRESIRLLIDQHITLFGNDKAGKEHIGSIDPNCNVAEIVELAADEAASLCDQYYMIYPKVEIEECNVVRPGVPVTFCYIRSHLYYMIFELLKNSMRATIEKHSGNSSEVPSIKVMISKGQTDLVIRILDRGGGIPLGELENVFSYTYSTAPQPPSTDTHTHREAVTPLAGYGYGLPLSRLFARYLNGDLRLLPLEGYGMDASIYLKRLSVNANEVIPIFSEAASERYRIGDITGDWTVSQNCC